MLVQCVDSSYMFEFSVLAICACSESDGLTLGVLFYDYRGGEL